jgi:hypothetical protein
VDKLVIEDNVIEMMDQKQYEVGVPAAGIILSDGKGIDPPPPYIFTEAVVRGNIVRFMDGIFVLVQRECHFPG